MRQTGISARNAPGPQARSAVKAVNDALLRPQQTSSATAWQGLVVNGARTHLSLKKDTPAGRPVQRVGTITSVPYLGELHHSFVRI